MSNAKRIEQSFAFRTKDGIKRPTVSVEFDSPNAAGLIQLLQSEDPKVVSYLEDMTSSALAAHIRTYVDSDENFNQETLDAMVAEGKISIEALANLPKSERNTLTKEQLEDFARDYIAIMPEVTGKDVKRIQMAAGLFAERFKRCAGDNTVLAVLQEQLGVFIEAADSEVLSKHERALEYLAAKLEELLSIKVTADAL